MQDPALCLVELHPVGLSPWVQPIHFPLQSLPTLKEINTLSELGVICKLTEGALDPLVQITDGDIEKKWPQYWAQWDTTSDWPPAAFSSIHHSNLDLATQTVFDPLMHTSIQALSRQFLWENAVGNGFKSLTEV